MYQRSNLLKLLFVAVVMLVLVGCGQVVRAAQGTMEMVAALRATATPLPTSTPMPTATPSGGAITATLSDDQILDIAEAMTIRVYEKVSPSVVHITSKVINMDFFGGLYPSEGTGSGFIIDKQGHIVTNHHVIEDAETIEVTLLDGTVAEARVIGTDPLNDLAVIQVNVDPAKLQPVDMSYEGDLKVGQRAIAIGNPFGLDWTLTSGVISSIGRPLQVSSERIIFDVIQTDAAINPGNSGGPLLNSRGQLIGVNAAIRSGAENIGFAIPLGTLRRVVPELIANGRYPHPWLGVAGYSLGPELAKNLNLPVEKGVLVARVYNNSPAVRAGLQGASREAIIGNRRLLVGGDIIVELDGQTIDSNITLTQVLETRTRVGDEVEIKFYRGNKLMSARVKLAVTPN